MSTILVAEDNALNQGLIRQLLEELGHHVTVVGSGHAALARLELEDFDLVLMDVQMPGLSGLEAVAQLRAREREQGGHVRVIALTALTANREVERCLEAGMDGYLAKPIDIAELERVIDGAAPSAAARRFPADTGSPYRATTLKNRVGRDRELWLELGRIFEARGQVLLSRMESAIEGRHPELLSEAAHELKGMLLNLAATNAYRTVRELEAAGASTRYEVAAGCLARLAEEVPRLVAALRTGAHA